MPASLRDKPSPAGKVIRALVPGNKVFPTGKKEGLWWEVSDENDNLGWTLNTKLEPAR
jgi:hypothetical protein